jgi:RND family efflux transporter MFP subunit
VRQFFGTRRACQLRVHRWPFAGIATLMLMGALAGGCSDSSQETADVPPRVQVTSLRLQTLRPEMREISETIIGTGTIGAVQTSNIGTVTPGIIERVFVIVGDRVEKGQPLFQTRKNDYEIGVQLAQAEFTAATARAEQARLDYERATELLTKNFISQAQLDTAANERKAAAAVADVAAARLAQADQSLADTVVRAPYDGVVTERNVDEGTFKSTQSYSADSAILQLQQIDVVIAGVRVPEIYLGRLSLGMPADLLVDGLQGSLESQIAVINDKVDRVSRTIDVRLALANDDYRVKPGLFVRAEIHAPVRMAMLLNHEAVLERASNPHVFVLDEGVARLQPVELRDFDASKLEIVLGLGEEDKVIVGPDLIRLVDGDPVPGAINAHH